MQWNWQTGGQNAYDAARNALNQNRQKMYNQNMDERQVGNGLDMMSWMQQGNDAAQYQAQQEQAAAQQAQAEEAQRAEQINMIKSQIAELQKSIADKQMRLQNFDDGVNEIAAIEARKINSQDPTMIWRWQKQREDTARANNSINTSDAKKFQNTVDMLVDQRPSTSTAGIENQIRNIETALRDGKNLGADVTALKALQDKKAELEDLIYGSGEASGDFSSGTTRENFKHATNDFMKSGNSYSELKQYYDENKDKMDGDTNEKFREAMRTQIKKEKAEAEAKEFDEFVKSQGYDPKTLTPRMRETMKRLHKAKRGK